MRLKQRGKLDETASQPADFVLQLGNSKIPLPADTVVQATNRRSSPREDEQVNTFRSSDSASSEAERAVNALLRMRQNLSSTSMSSGDDSSWRPWSPDDVYPPPQDFQAHYLHGSPNGTIMQGQWQQTGPRVMEYREWSPQSYHMEQRGDTFTSHPTQWSERAPTIFDGLDEQSRRMTSSPIQSPQYRESTSSKKPKKLDLTQLFPQPTQSKGRILSSKRSRSPSTTSKNSDSPNLSSKTGLGLSRRYRSGTQSSNSGSMNKVKVVEDDVIEHAKNHVRRPPKGIQNWFDGFISSDENESEEEEEEEEEIDIGPEPQELPADEIPPPAYSAGERRFSFSRQSQKSAIDVELPAENAVRPQAPVIQATPLSRADSDSASTFADSFASSQVASRQRSGEDKFTRSKLASESVLSLSASSSTSSDSEEEEEVIHQPLRDSIDDPQNVTFGSASTVDLQRLLVPRDDEQRSGRSPNRSEPTPRDSATTIDSSRSVSTFIPTRPHERSVDPSMASLDPTEIALRRLNGLSMASKATASTTTTFERNSSAELAADPTINVPPDASHVMAVTEEEMLLLELMRRKHAAMQQISFTEGYQLALRKGERPSVVRSSSADKAALRVLKKGGHKSHNSGNSEAKYYENMKKKLSMIQKQDVDEALKMKRFLESDSPPPQALSAAEEKHMPMALPSSKPRSDVFSSSRYSSTAVSDSRATTRDSDSDSDTDLDMRRIRSSNSIPKNSSAFTTSLGNKPSRRQSYRGSPNAAPPSPVIEEDMAPVVPARNPDRARKTSSRQSRNNPRKGSRPSDIMTRSDTASTGDASTKRGADAPSKLKNSPSVSGRTSSPLSSIITAAAQQGKAPTSRTTAARHQSGTDTPDTEHSQTTNDKKNPTKRPVPKSIMTEGSTDPRSSRLKFNSAGEDVLAAWAELGGGSDCLRRR